MRKNQYENNYCGNHDEKIKADMSGDRGCVRICGGQRVYFAVCVSVLLAYTIFLCGCTRREQLVLDLEGTAQTGEAAAQQSDGASAGAMQSQTTTEDQGQPGSAAETDGQTASEQLSQQSVNVWEETVQEKETPMICVHVCGAVRKPAVYELPAGSRVYEAVEKAGGFTEDADESYVNQAQTLSDGVKLVIPTMKQTDEIGVSGEVELPIGIVSAAEGISVPENDALAPSASDGRININTASESELCGIPGIGATRAAAIVAYRQERGGFSSIEEIMNVSGIKEGTYAKIKDSIKVN